MTFDFQLGCSLSSSDGRFGGGLGSEPGQALRVEGGLKEPDQQVQAQEQIFLLDRPVESQAAPLDAREGKKFETRARRPDHQRVTRGS